MVIITVDDSFFMMATISSDNFTGAFSCSTLISPIHGSVTHKGMTMPLNLYQEQDNERLDKNALGPIHDRLQ